MPVCLTFSTLRRLLLGVLTVLWMPPLLALQWTVQWTELHLHRVLRLAGTRAMTVCVPTTPGLVTLHQAPGPAFLPAVRSRTLMARSSG